MVSRLLTISAIIVLSLPVYSQALECDSEKGLRILTAKRTFSKFDTAHYTFSFNIEESRKYSFIIITSKIEDGGPPFMKSYLVIKKNCRIKKCYDGEFEVGKYLKK